MFEILCIILNKHKVGDVTTLEKVCGDQMFLDSGYVYVYIREQIIQYLYLLGKNKKGIKFVRFSLLDRKIHILEKISDFKIKNYKN